MPYNLVRRFSAPRRRPWPAGRQVGLTQFCFAGNPELLLTNTTERWYYLFKESDEMIFRTKYVTDRWVSWFAWRPIPINNQGDRVWLKMVERKFELKHGRFWLCHYRLIGSEEFGTLDVLQDTKSIPC